VIAVLPSKPSDGQPEPSSDIAPATRERLERILLRFEDAWQRGERPALDGFLEGYAVGSPDRRVLLTELAHADLHYRLAAGEPASADDYTHRFPELAADPEAARGLALAERRLRNVGRAIDSSDWLRCPPSRPEESTAESESGHRASEPFTASTPAPPAGARTLPAPATVPELGQGGATDGLPSIPGYEVLGELGRGATGVVYKARQVALGRVVALKMIAAAELAGREELARFRAEAEALAHLRHPNIVQIYEVGEAGGRPYFSLEYCEGGSLARQLNATPLPPREAALLVETLARAVEAAHRQHVLHRDLKPGNILLGREGLTGRPGWREWALKVADFGLAKRLDEAGRTATGAVLGTPSYMAPEQAVGLTRAIGPQVDVYALGAILYETLTGRAPFRGANLFDTIEQVRTREPVPPSQLQPRLPRDLETICLKCLQKDPRKRYQSALELSEELRRFVDGEPIRARPAGRLERTTKWVHRRPVLAALIAVSTVGVLALAGMTVVLSQMVMQRDAALRAERDQSAAAEAARAVAEKSQGEARTLLYTADLRGASQFWRNGEAQALRDAVKRHSTEEHGTAFEFAYFSRLAHAGEMETLSGHEAEVICAAYSPDGATLASGDGNGSVRLWDTATSRQKARLDGHPGGVQWLGFLDGGKILAAATKEDLWLWDAIPGTLREKRPFKGRMTQIALSSDGGTLALALADHNIKLWDTARRTEHSLGKLHDSDATALAVSPDGRLFAMASRDRFVDIRDGATGQTRTTQRMETEPTALAFSGNSWYLAIGERQGTLRLVPTGIANLADVYGDLTTTQRRFHTGPVRTVAFTVDNEGIVSAGDDATVRLWDMRRQKLRNTFHGHTDRVWAVAVAPDGRAIASAGADRALKLWDLGRHQGRQPLGTPLEASGPVAFSADGRLLAVACRDNAIALVDPQTGARRARLPGHRGKIQGLAFSRQGLLASAGVDLIVRVWDPTAACLVKELFSGHIPHCAAFTPDGSQLRVGLDTGLIPGWEVPSGKPLPPMQGDKQIYALAFSTDGKVLAGGGATGTVWRWDSATGEALAKDPEKHAAPVRTLAFVHGMVKSDSWPVAYAPDGATLVQARPDGFWVREVRSNTERLVVYAAHADGTLQVAFSPDGKQLASTGEDGTVKLWDTAHWQMRRPFGQLPGPVTALAFSADGKTLITGSTSRRPLATYFVEKLGIKGKNIRSLSGPDDLRLWDAVSAEELVPPPGGQHGEGVQCLAVPAQGDWFLAGSKGGALARWDLARRRQNGPLLFVSPVAENWWKLANQSQGFLDIVPGFAGDFHIETDLKHTVHAVAIHPNSKHFATTADYDDGAGLVQLGEIGGPERSDLRRAIRDPAALAFSPDGLLLAVNDGRDVLLLELGTGKEARRLSGAHRDPITCLAYSPDGRLLATGSADRRLVLWTMSGLPKDADRHVLLGHTDTISCLAFSRDGNTLASGSWDGTIRLWHTATFQEMGTLEGHTGRVYALAFSPDGKALASGGEAANGSGEAFLWRSDGP
jgi:WD40 repeat protein